MSARLYSRNIERMIFSSAKLFAARVAPVLFCAVAVFILLPARASAAVTFINGNFENCSATSGGSTAGACPTVNAGDGGFAFGVNSGGAGDYMQGWILLNPNNLHLRGDRPHKRQFRLRRGAGPADREKLCKLYALLPQPALPAESTWSPMPTLSTTTTQPFTKRQLG